MQTVLECVGHKVAIKSPLREAIMAHIVIAPDVTCIIFNQVFKTFSFKFIMRFD